MRLAISSAGFLSWPRASIVALATLTLLELPNAPSLREHGSAATAGKTPDLAIAASVDELIEPFLDKDDPAKEQADATGSRLGPWRVEYRGVRWGMKSLYYSVMKAMGEEWGSPGAFHSSRARAYWNNHQFSVICE